MPELPEVETMVRGLRPVLEGRRVERMDLHDPSMLRGCEAREFGRLGRGVDVIEVRRRGKWVVIGLADHRGLIVIQPRMTGGFWLVEPSRMEHVRLSIRLASPGGIVWFCDARRLGRIEWFADQAAAEGAFARSHGPDALAITAEELAARLKTTRRGIKPALMDQKVLAGIGNIYADEVLHASGIHPQRVASRLTREEYARLHAAIGRVLAVAIEAEGSSFDAGYRTVLGLEGGFLAMNSAYGRAGEPCRTCGGPIQKTKIPGLIGRPTYLCPACQPRGRRRPARGII
ncbi:Formamidopyrimidine-DNA glycosylase [Aquisphaera giovannonii]|uniref:Formamidopyrimidine-DNA glycosylase n=1 Tax=Aquisphaera giovannonii TaxID=406548 RepID=A0A5B9W7G7_9BACT|nr:bifunctional DNA-formamidopyrimidine glycosylase/DNA-(apurinic or apyrimidinic site) lyase [Aquisphaera giovannonii]QEH36626.1 Formamidopyrimidine-DNA glycosylase [Aquisphaera giovannonii]